MGGLWAALPLWVCWQVSGERPGIGLVNRTNSQEEDPDAQGRARTSWNPLSCLLCSVTASSLKALQQVTDAALLLPSKSHTSSSFGQLSVRTM